MTHISLPHLLLRSLRHRRARGFAALVALTVSAAVATALLTLYRDLDHKMHDEFRNFGANLTLTSPTAGQPLPPNTLQQVRSLLPPGALATELAFAVATTDRNTSVVVAGVDPATIRQLDAWWSPPAWLSAPTDALLGTRAAQFIADEHTVTLRYNNQPLALHGIGRLQTGGDEDSRVFLPLPTFTRWTGVQPSLIEAEVPGGAPAVEQTLTRLRAALPGLRIEPVRQLVAGETSIVDRTHALMYAAVLLIALTVGVSVLATLSASVLERRRDFALMKALGSSQTRILRLFLLEALVLSLLAVVAGWLLGSAVAFLISELNFHTGTAPSLFVLLPVALLNCGIALLAALAPLQTLRRLEPAALLRGE